MFIIMQLLKKKAAANKLQPQFSHLCFSDLKLKIFLLKFKAMSSVFKKKSKK